MPCVQLCDGPLATPETLELPAALPLGMTADGSVLQVEARALRQVPGEGEFPLAELLAAVPVGTPISVEVPNAGLQARLSPVEFAARNLRGVRKLEASPAGHHDHRFGAKPGHIWPPFSPNRRSCAGAPAWTLRYRASCCIL